MTAPTYVGTRWDLDRFDPGPGLPVLTRSPSLVTVQGTLDAILVAAGKANIELRFSATGDPGNAPSDPYVTESELLSRLGALPPGGSTVAAGVDDDGTPVLVGLSTGKARFSPPDGHGVARTLGKLRRKKTVSIAVIGDSKQDTTTPGNVGGSATQLLVTDLLTRFPGATINLTSVAKSGHTAARQFIEGYVTTAVAAVPDLVVIELGTNDSNSDQYGPFAAGYVLDASLAAVERMCAYFRDANESCEFLFVLTSPYIPPANSTSNLKIAAYNTAMRELAATVGAEVVDLFSAFTVLGDWTPQMYDSTHRNGAGNTVAKDAMLVHFPTAAPPLNRAAGPRAVTGRYGISNVDKTKGLFGYVNLSAPGGNSSAAVAVTGTWSISGNYDVTSTPGDYVELSGTSIREFFADIDLTDVAGGAGAVVDFTLDGNVIGANVDLHSLSSKNTAAYWVAPVTGLDGGAHTLRITLKSGTLRIASYAMLAGAVTSFTPATKLVNLGSGSTATAMDTAGAYTTIVNTVLGLPAGWGSADVFVSGYVMLRVAATTTTKRTFNMRILHASTAQFSLTWDCQASVPAGDNAYSGPLALRSSMTSAGTGDSGSLTGNKQIRLDVRLISTDKTTCYVSGWDLGATLVRTS